MQEIELIAVSKGADYLEIHPTTLKSHAEQGWRVCDKRDEAQDESPKLSVAEIREALAVRGIAIPEGAKKAELRALLEANT